MIFSDLNLSRTIERAEGASNAAFVEARALLSPESGACWKTIGGAYAMFDGVNSPCTQTFGLGVFEEATAAGLDELEAFFRERSAPVLHEVSPLAGVPTLDLLGERGYRPVELSSIMYLDLTMGVDLGFELNPDLSTRVIEPGEEDLWAEVSSAGWASEPGMAEFGDFLHEFARISSRSNGGFPFLAELDGKAISSGMLFIHGDAAVLAGASTIPEGRRRGAQTALLDARLRLAAAKNCRIAVMGAVPGSQSQRNAEKNRFRIAYTRSKWMLGD